MSLAFNIPKWFECYVDWEVVSNTTVVHQFNQTANQSSFEIVSKISFSNPSTNNILNKNNMLPQLVFIMCVTVHFRIGNPILQ